MNFRKKNYKGGKIYELFENVDLVFVLDFRRKDLIMCSTNIYILNFCGRSNNKSNIHIINLNIENST